MTIFWNIFLLLLPLIFGWENCFISAISKTNEYTTIQPSTSTFDQIRTIKATHDRKGFPQPLKSFASKTAQLPEEHGFRKLLLSNFPLFISHDTENPQNGIKKFSKRIIDILTLPVVQKNENSDSGDTSEDGIFDSNYFFKNSQDGFEALQESEFHDSLLSPLKKSWNRTPPITKLYLTSSFSITLYSFLFLKNIWPSLFKLNWPAVLQGHIWRPITCFFFLGNFGISYLLTAQFIWNYMANLEKMMCKKPEMFLTMVLFGMTSLLSVYPLFGLANHMIGHNLAIFFVYLWSKLHEGEHINMMELFEMKVEYLPWVFFGQSWIFGGEPPLTDLIGIGFGALFHYLYFQRKIETPKFLVDVFKHPRIQKAYEQFRDDYE